MNDLRKKEELQLDEKAKAAQANNLLQQKLENFLALLYQGYLKGETDIAVDIRQALLAAVLRNEDFALKIRMLQLDYLQLENVQLMGAWNEATETLFPKVEEGDAPLDEGRKKTLDAYKETLLELLSSTSELGS